ncbi:hypothetical protein HQN90_19340 [Paenibacillus alba]|uniref:hypothetical protein n=1 Tax=Paenibacillus alba TaxID=1197127 RepID=UPI0015654824|nr:hypothetical protein [Paenibacillus alba]NQX68282.1 hypothetical protein [Paenibacillus alba]
MKLIYATEGTLASTDTQTHQTYFFPVSENCRTLHLIFDYSPACLEDEEAAKQIIQASQMKYQENSEHQVEDGWKKYLPLRNLLTVSLDDPAKFRGACHRKDISQQLFLTAEEASPGLMPGPLVAGKWSVTLSFHAIVTETCDFKLVVWEEEGSL